MVVRWRAWDVTLKLASGMCVQSSCEMVPDQRVQATLRMMQRAANTVLTEEVGRDVCQRVGARALLTSAIASLGSSYVITLGAQDCVTGETLAERQVQASRKEDVLRELGEATTMFREQLGESLASIKRYDAKVEMATTRSLEALKAYSQALAARRTHGRPRRLTADASGSRARPGVRARTRPARHGLRQPARLRGQPPPRHAGLRAAGEGERAGAPLHRGPLLHHRPARSGQSHRGLPGGRLPPIPPTMPRGPTSPCC